MISYRIVYPAGDRSRLTVAPVRDYETDDWALASRQNFGEDSEAAWAHCHALAKEHGLAVDDDRPSGKQHDYLD